MRPFARAGTGFTLLEVLVALVIVGTALAASMRAVGSLTSNSAGLRAAMMATWSAENRLVQIRLSRSFPPLGKNNYECPQGDLQLQCQEEVIASPNPRLRRVEVSVFDAQAPERRIIKLVQLVLNDRAGMDRHMRRGTAHRARGFTLIELLVAISILAIVAVMGWRGLDGIVRARSALTEQMEMTRGMQLAFAQMQSDCEHLSDVELLHHRPNLMADTDRLTLVRNVFTENEAARVQVVSYRIVDGVLARRESAATRDLAALDVMWQAAIGASDSLAAVTLQAGVTGMVVQVWEGSGWHVSTPASASSGNAALVSSAPTGLEVALQVRGVATSMTKVFLLGGV